MRGLTVMFLLFVSTGALACPVCGGGGQNQQAFVDTMVFMSLTPLAMLGGVAGVVWYLAKRAREIEAEEEPG
ncbi:MAG: hypothetical protein H6736_16275 [Alphaproteobacteria bacterium]|nr:hypothetical protein [Alphaproteobacteria bacterium]MCB9693370.1 hypothetical protein [Alphaproteobacteria bacterium]